MLHQAPLPHPRMLAEYLPICVIPTGHSPVQAVEFVGQKMQALLAVMIEMCCLHGVGCMHVQEATSAVNDVEECLFVIETFMDWSDRCHTHNDGIDDEREGNHHPAAHASEL